MSIVKRIFFGIGFSFFIFPNAILSMDLKELYHDKKHRNHVLQRVKEIYGSSYDSFRGMHTLPKCLNLKGKQSESIKSWINFHKFYKNYCVNECHNGENEQGLFDWLQYAKHTLKDEIEYHEHLIDLYKNSYINDILIDQKKLLVRSPSLPNFIEFINKIKLLNKLDNEKYIFNESQEAFIIDIFSSYQKYIYGNYPFEKKKIFFTNKPLESKNDFNSQENKSFTRFIENKFDIFSSLIDIDENTREKIGIMIENEEKYPNYIPFYHAYNEQAGVLYAIYSEILNTTYKYENPINWASRLLPPTQSINDLKMICDSKGTDKGPEFCRNGVCATTSILTNFWADSESAYMLWKDGRVVTSRNFFSILTASLLEDQYNKTAVDEFVEKIQYFYEKLYPQGGEVQQIFIHKDVVDDVCYLSKCWGKSIPVREEQIITPTAKQIRDFWFLKQMFPSKMFSSNIFKTCLAFYSRDNIVNSIHEIFEKVKLGTILEIDGEKDEDSLKCIQARILFDPEIMVNQEKVKIFTHHTKEDMELDLHYFKLAIQPHIAKLIEDRNQSNY